MTMYSVPAEPSCSVWLADHPEHGGPLRFDPEGTVRTWRNREHGIELAWVELLGLGEVDDEYPGRFDFHDTALPWQVLGTSVVDASGADVLDVSGECTTTADDQALAALIVELVNRHAAGDGPDQSQEAAAAERAESALRDAYALAANELVLNWRIAPVELRVEVGAANSKLVERLDAFVDAHARVR